MKVLVIGGGGREHALVWAMQQSAAAPEVVCAPGNAGIAAIARCVPVDMKDLSGMVSLALAEQPDLTVIGPELPLSLGLVDELTLRGYRVFGPTRAAAMLETSKAFAKQFMQRHNLPTAGYAVCHSLEEIDDALGHFSAPVVVKADGLAAGKGVAICDSRETARTAAQEMLNGRLLGSRQQAVVLEEFLAGDEVSLLVLSDGERVLPLAPARDYKRIGENNTGPNTGGMGAYSTNTLLEPEMVDWLVTHIAQPAVDGMMAEGTPFCGVLYCGLMMTARGPMLLEFNARFGDPETEAILPRIDEKGGRGGLLEALDAAAAGRLAPDQLSWKRQPSVTVIAASAGYPGSFKAGLPITGLEEAAHTEDVVIFHAGTVRSEGAVVTAGGRVLAVTALGETVRQAQQRAYAAIDAIQFQGKYCRRDIARQALEDTAE